MNNTIITSIARFHIPESALVAGNGMQFIECDFDNLSDLYSSASAFHTKYGAGLGKIVKNNPPVSPGIYAQLAAYTNVFYQKHKDAYEKDGTALGERLSDKLQERSFMCFEHALCAQGYFQRIGLNSCFMGGTIYQHELKNNRNGLHAFLWIKDKGLSNTFIYDPFHSMQLALLKESPVALPALFYVNASENSIDSFLKHPDRYCKVFKVIDINNELSRWYGYTNALTTKQHLDRLKALDQNFNKIADLHQSGKISEQAAGKRFEKLNKHLDDIANKIPVDRTVGNAARLMPDPIKNELFSFLQKTK
jgi:hypothetical protein